MTLQFAYVHVQKVARYLVPPYDERKPITASNALYLFLPSLSLLLMAGLARRRGTWTLRLAFLPVALAITLRMSCGLFINDEYFNQLNYAIGESTGTM